MRKFICMLWISTMLLSVAGCGFSIANTKTTPGAEETVSIPDERMEDFAVDEDYEQETDDVDLDSENTSDVLTSMESKTDFGDDWDTVDYDGSLLGVKMSGYQLLKEVPQEVQSYIAEYDIDYDGLEEGEAWAIVTIEFDGTNVISDNPYGTTLHLSADITSKGERSPHGEDGSWIVSSTLALPNKPRVTKDNLMVTTVYAQVVPDTFKDPIFQLSYFNDVLIEWNLE